MSGYLPFWLGSPLLAALVLGFAWRVRRPFGVSGSWTRVTGFVEERAARRGEAALGDDSDYEAALLAATAEEFGAAAIAAPPPAPVEAPAPSRRAPIRLTPAMHLGFLAAIVAGAFLAAWSRGPLRLLSIGDSFTRFAGTGLRADLILVAGGLLVGFGARMAGGCTTGHGLSGCSRMQPGSLLAIAAFFGTAVLVSFTVLPR